VKRLLVAVAAAALAGCAQPREDGAKHPPSDDADAQAAATAADVARALGQTAGVSAQLHLQLTEPGHDAQSFSVSLWCTPDGRVRVLATAEAGVEFCSALLRADGSYEAWLPRAKVGSRGSLDAAVKEDSHHAGLLAALRVVAKELTDGPLPLGGPYHAGPGPGTLLCPAGAGLTAQLAVDRDARTVTSKRLFEGDHELVTIAYDRYDGHDEERRAGRARLTFPEDQTRVLIRLVDFNGVPTISEERMRFTLPEGAELVPLREFLSRMGE
jgi:hypothetical protein